LGRGLRMELDAPSIPVRDPESLVRVLGATREDLSPGRRFEHVVVPLIDPCRLFEVAEKGVRGRRLGRRDLEPPSLRFRCPRHLSAKGTREDLRAEADPEHGHIVFNRALEKQALTAEERNCLLVVRVCVSAEWDERAYVVYVDVLDALIPGAQAAV